MGRAWCVAACLVLAFASSLDAKPLPKGWKVTVKKGKPYLTADKVTVLLVDTFDAWTDVTATLTDSGGLAISYGRCGEPAGELEPHELSAAEVGAKLANAQGMALHVKKKYADAAALFEKATTADPATAVYATNWLSALAMGGEVEKASKLLDGGLGAQHLAWYAWRLAVDPELRAIKDVAATKRFRADKAGKVTVKALGDKDVYVSPLGIAALKTANMFGQSFVSFVQLDSGTETLRLPIKQAKVIDGLLATLGFAKATSKLARFDDAEPILEKMKAVGDIKAVAEIGQHYIYIERTGGCDVSEFDFHAAAEKR